MNLRARIIGIAALLAIPALSHAATLTVGVGGGCPCTYATIAAAYAAAASGDTIMLKSNMNEDVNINRGIDISFTSDTGARVWDGANDGNPTLTSTNGNNHILNITSLIMDHSSASGGYVLYFPQHDVNLTVTTSILRRTSTSTTNNAIFWPGPDMLPSHFIQTKFYGNAFSIGISENAGNANEVDLVNCTLSGFTGTNPGAGYAVFANNGNHCYGVNMMNCTLQNNTVAYWDNYAGTNTPGKPWYITNNLFINNGLDMRVAPSEPVANTWGHMSYNAFSQQTTNANFGPGNIFGVNPASEVINPCTGACTPDLHLRAGAQSVDKAVNVNAQGASAPGNDMDGVLRPQGPAKDIGAYEGVACATGYLPNVAFNGWAQSTPVCILIVSPTPTQTPAPSATMTVTPAMGITKTVNQGTATIGDTLTFCLNWKNDSGATQTMNLWDTVPSTLTYMSCDHACTKPANIVLWSFSAVAGASGTVCFWGTVNGYPMLPHWIEAVAAARPQEDLEKLFLGNY